jgi:stage II sporulation protein D
VKRAALKGVLALLLLLHCFGADASSGPAAPSAALERVSRSIVQIGLFSRVKKAVLRPEAPFVATDQSDGRSHPLPQGRAFEVRASRGGGVRLGDMSLGGIVRLTPKNPGGSVLVGTRRYRGNLLLKPGEGGTVTVVNELGLEEYLYGVLPREMSPDWPLEALKAQAVVARTWALNNLGKYAELGYDLTDDDRSQVYSGLDVEDERARRAVRETAGQTLSWKGAPLNVFFHSCCGGHTAPATAVWGGEEKPPKPLRGVRDRWCADSPHARWTAYFTDDTILEALQGRGMMGARLERIAPGERDGSGHLKEIRLRVDGRSFTVRAGDLRSWLGAADIKSSQIWRIVRRRHGWEFVGRGYGHGVGLCQWGARAMADDAKSYRKILSHYFPGADIVVRDELR